MKQISTISLIALFTTPTLALTSELIAQTAGHSATEYVLINFNSNGLIINTASGTEIGGGNIEKAKNGKIEIFSKKSCEKAVNNKIKELKEFEPDFIYHNNGIYEISGNFGRICCIPFNKIDKKYIGTDPVGFYIEIEPFFDEYREQISNKIDISKVSSYSIFPFEQ